MFFFTDLSIAASFINISVIPLAFYVYGSALGLLMTGSDVVWGQCDGFRPAEFSEPVKNTN